MTDAFVHTQSHHQHLLQSVGKNTLCNGDSERERLYDGEDGGPAGRRLLMRTQCVKQRMDGDLSSTVFVMLCANVPLLIGSCVNGTYRILSERRCSHAHARMHARTHNHTRDTGPSTTA